MLNINIYIYIFRNDKIFPNIKDHQIIIIKFNCVVFLNTFYACYDKKVSG